MRRPLVEILSQLTRDFLDRLFELLDSLSEVDQFDEASQRGVGVPKGARGPLEHLPCPPEPPESPKVPFRDRARWRLAAGSGFVELDPASRMTKPRMPWVAHASGTQLTCDAPSVSARQGVEDTLGCGIDVPNLEESGLIANMVTAAPIRASPAIAGTITGHQLPRGS